MLLHYAIDAFFILIVILASLHGFRRGFLASIVSSGGKVAAIIVAFCFRTPFAQFLDSLFSLRQKLTPVVSSSINNFLNDAIMQKNLSFPLPPSVETSYSSYITSLQDTFVNRFTDTCVFYLLEIIAISILLFMVYSIVSILIRFFIKTPSKIMSNKHSGPFWNKRVLLSKATGMLISCVCIVFFISVFFGLIQPFLQVTPVFESEINHSFFYPLLAGFSQPYLETILGNPSNAITDFFPTDLLPANLLPPELTPTFKSLKI